MGKGEDCGSGWLLAEKADEEGGDLLKRLLSMKISLLGKSEAMNPRKWQKISNLSNAVSQLWDWEVATYVPLPFWKLELIFPSSWDGVTFEETN